MFLRRKWLIMLMLSVILLISACSSEDSSDTNNSRDTQSDTSDTSKPKEEEIEEEEIEEEVDEESKYADSFINDVEIITDEVVELSQESYDFIVENNSYFPAFDKTDIKKMKDKADTSITAKQINKNVQPYFQKIITF